MDAIGVREPDQPDSLGGPPAPPGARGRPPRFMSIVCPVTGLEKRLVQKRVNEM